jgi:hypothetical protein
VRTRPGERPATKQSKRLASAERSQMEYEIGITIYGYIVVEAPSRNDAVEMFAAMRIDQILQDMKVNSIDSEHINKIRMRGGELCQSNHKPGITAK